MITRYRVWMDGRALDAVDEAVCILDIQESAPSVNVKTQAPARGDGLRMLRRSRERLDVTISLAIREQDVTRRKEIAGRINAWAQGKYLAVNDRPTQQLAVLLTTPVMVSSALKWTDTLRLTFTAYESPWWEDAFPSSARMSAGATGSGTLPLPGNLGNARVEVHAEAMAACSNLTLNCGRTQLRFEGLNMVAQETLHVHYKDGVQRITITGPGGERCALAMRTTDSDDDLLAASGGVTAVSYVADGSMRVVFSGRGRFA